MRLGRYWRTLKHLRAEQLIYLVWRRVLRQPRRVQAPEWNAPRLNAALGCLIPLAEPCWLGGKRFRFLNHELDFGDAIDWSASGASRLWRYNLHYFDWLRQDDCPSSTALAQIEHWIAANPPFVGTGWEPYPTSLRLINWLGALANLPATAWPRAVIDSIALQAAWLAGNVELQLGANHLFVNLKALLFATAFCGEAFARIGRGDLRTRFARELAEQFLADGGHYERSPMYHALLTQDLLELVALVGRNYRLLSEPVCSELTATAVRAMRWMATLMPPDASVCLFNDAASGIAPTWAALGAFAREACKLPQPKRPRAQGLDLRALADSGYYIARRDDDMLVFDAGPVGAAHQPGHVHCDLLSFELFLHGRRVLGNCGNYDYEPSPQRAFARSTRAHNTVMVDGAEQSEIWGVFRVGRRAAPIEASLQEVADGARFRAAHDGYHCLPGVVTHTREVHIQDDFTLLVSDTLSGTGVHEACAWLHCASDLTVHAVATAFELRDSVGQVLLVIDHIAGAHADIVTTPRFPAFGVELSGMSLCLCAQGALPLVIRYRLRRHANDAT